MRKVRLGTLGSSLIVMTMRISGAFYKWWRAFSCCFSSVTRTLRELLFLFHRQGNRGSEKF